MDAQELLELLTVDNIKTILTELGAQHIIDHSQDSRKKELLTTNTICHNISDGNLKLLYYEDTKQFHCYTACGENHSIFDLVMSNFKLKGVELSFPETISWICSTVGIQNNGYRKPDGFGNRIAEKKNDELDYYKKFKKKKQPIITLKEHSEKIFNMYSTYHHPAFLDDGISHEAMDRFGVMFDPLRHRIIIPHRKWDNGRLIGIKTRNLNQWEIDAGYKYIPLSEHGILYSYPTSANLYAYWENRENIKKYKKAWLFESEKSNLQIESFYGRDRNISLILCGSTLSQIHVELILELGLEEITLCLDKENSNDLDEKSIEYQEKLLRIGRMLAPYMRVYVIYDDNGVLEEKSSPSDYGKDTFELLLKNRKEILMKG